MTEFVPVESARIAEELGNSGHYVIRSLPPSEFHFGMFDAGIAKGVISRDRTDEPVQFVPIKRYG